jgi:glucosamine--fructose-6-phosphate aminotransferase (isomerizing)
MIAYDPASAGRRMKAEMDEQPAVLASSVARFDTVAAEVRELVANGVAGVAFLARGSSDNAAVLGRYAVELSSGLPTCLVAPSLSTAYDRFPRGFGGWLVVALSQSGQTPEIVHLAEAFVTAGAKVVGVTNDERSGLASAAHLSIALEAGREVAVPATKTVTAQMLAMLAVAAGLGAAGRPGVLTTRDLAALPEAVGAVLADEGPVRDVAAQLAAYRRMAVVGRGFSYAAALETALKLQETTGILAHGFSTADFRHGPVAVCGPDAPGVLLAGSNPADADTRDVRKVLDDRGAPSVLVGTAADGAVPHLTWSALGGPAECILATVRGQQLAIETSRCLGVDPDQPAGLNKVTLTH